MEIKLNDVSYKNIKNLNLEIKENTINSIIGKSFSGKTTILKLISGQIKPDSGKILVKRTVKYVEEIKYINKTVREYIDKTINIKEFYKYLELLNLNKEYISRKINTLSKSENIKISLAIALAINPDIILLDEITTYLDDRSKSNLIRIIRDLKRIYKKTILIVSNDTEFISKISDKIFLINNGKIIRSDEKNEILKDQLLLYENNILPPNTIKFTNLVNFKKHINIGYRNDINDLIKDIYRFVN